LSANGSVDSFFGLLQIFILYAFAFLLLRACNPRQGIYTLPIIGIAQKLYQLQKVILGM